VGEVTVSADTAVREVVAELAVTVGNNIDDLPEALPTLAPSLV
jgi:hypothetical protein